MRIVIAIGGNALLQHGEIASFSHMQTHVEQCAKALAPVCQVHEVVLVHGNGPQVGLLALQNHAYKTVPAYPLDCLVAESQGLIGYLLQLALANVLTRQTCVTLLTQVEVANDDPAFRTPTKPIGPFYTSAEKRALESEQPHWTFTQMNDEWRRVVASPAPKAIIEQSAISQALANKQLVITCGGGGIPVQRDASGKLSGIEAVIDKDASAALLARKLNADRLIILTDVDGVYQDYGLKSAHLLTTLSIDEANQLQLAQGSMAPKVEACVDFVTKTGKTAAIGNLNQISAILAGEKGTRINLNKALA